MAGQFIERDRDPESADAQGDEMVASAGLTKTVTSSRCLLRCAFACVMLSITVATSAQDDATQYDFDIGHLPLAKAVQVFHLQTELQIGYLPSSPQEEQTLVGPIKGRYTASEALDRLLKPAGFSFQWVGSKVIDVIPPGDARLTDGAQKATTEGGERRPPSAYGSRAVDIERVIVTAGRIHDAENRAAPVKTFDRKSIQRIGAVTIADLLKYLTQQTYTYSEGFRVNGAQFAELRGLGPDMTLVLINGRRTLPSAVNVTSNAFDLNTIPITAVDRVEILLDSASAMYGTDAIGGVVNIVLRRDAPHPVADLHYGAADGGADERRASFSIGYRRPGANAALFADYIDVSPLLGAERSRWSNQDFRRFGGHDYRSVDSAPGNISAVLPGNLPGLPAPFAAVPRGSSGQAVTIANFLPTAGQRNLESQQRYTALVPESRRLSVLGSGEIELTPYLLASAEILHTQRRSRLQSAPISLPGVPVPASNAFNPFNVQILANVLLTGMEPRSLNAESVLTRAAVGLRGQLSTWDWEVYALRTHEKASTWIDGVLDFSRVMAALAQSDPRRALNVFQDGPAGSPSLLASLRADAEILRSMSKGMQATAFASGPLPFATSAGPLTLLAGSEWREEVAEFDASLGPLSRNITAGFAEINLPLVSDAMQLPTVEELSLTVSGRYDDYGDFGTIFNPQYGLIWRINRDLTLRFSNGRSFRPASMYELFLPRIAAPVTLTDPRRRELATFTLISQGNSKLKPTRGESFTGGFALAPAVLPGLEISANYWRVAADDRVSFVPYTIVLANEAALADRVVRADPTPADVAAGMPGRLISVDTSRANVGRLTTSGIDLNATYTIETSLGRFTPSLSATWIDHLEMTDLPLLPMVDRVNRANVAGTIIRWRVVPRLEWQRGIAEMSMNARYSPAYDDFDALSNARTERRVSSQTIVDIQASVDMGEQRDGKSMWRGFKVTVGALNMFDKHAPFSEVLGPAGFDMSQGDLKGRFIYVWLGKTF